jgi:hypothetical protein
LRCPPTALYRDAAGRPRWCRPQRPRFPRSTPDMQHRAAPAVALEMRQSWMATRRGCRPERRCGEARRSLRQSRARQGLWQNRKRSRRSSARTNNTRWRFGGAGATCHPTRLRRRRIAQSPPSSVTADIPIAPARACRTTSCGSVSVLRRWGCARRDCVFSRRFGRRSAHSHPAIHAAAPSDPSGWGLTAEDRPDHLVSAPRRQFSCQLCMRRSARDGRKRPSERSKERGLPRVMGVPMDGTTSSTMRLLKGTKPEFVCKLSKRPYSWTNLRGTAESAVATTCPWPRSIAVASTLRQ